MTSAELSTLAKTHADAIMLGSLTKAEIIMLSALIQARITEALLGSGLTASPVPATPKAPGMKIADKGYPCVCVMCAKHIYTVNKDVYDNTTVKEFIESYTPMPGYPAMTRQMKISNIDNNITTNCPSCGGELTLYLAGRQIG
jgi:hypothetical protein